MRLFLTTVFLAVSLANGSIAAEDIALSFEPIPQRKGYRLCISPTGPQFIMLGVQGGALQRNIKMDRTDTYYSNQTSIGPRLFRPLYSAEILDNDGKPIHKSLRNQMSLLDLHFDAPVEAFILQPGDRIAVHDGTYPELPEQIIVKIVTYDGRKWNERTLYWKQLR